MPLSLDNVFSSLGVDPLVEGVQVIAAAQIKPPEPFAPLLPFVTTRPLLVCGMDNESLVQRVHSALLAIYPNEHEARLVRQGTVTVSTVEQLAQSGHAPDVCVYLPAQAVLAAVRSFDTLREITARLRAPNGCPWDRQQTHESLRSFVLEETYEVLEALDSGNRQELREELGDLMMQVMIHAQVAVEAGEFDVGDVLAGISSKLMRRHPHVFGDVQVSGAQEVLRNWQSIKQAEKKNGDESPPSLLGGVPVQLPALAYAQAIQERASRVGFLRPEPNALDSVMLAVRMVSQAKTPDEKMSAYGELLFRLALAGRGIGVAAEDALREANRHYRERFMAVEAMCGERGLAMGELAEEERVRLWHEAE
jgi:tetrapyrrole methylase family protein / MazG family protein